MIKSPSYFHIYVEKYYPYDDELVAHTVFYRMVNLTSLLLKDSGKLFLYVFMILNCY